VSPSSVSLSIDTIGTVAPCCTATSMTGLYDGQPDFQALPDSRVVRECCGDWVGSRDESRELSRYLVLTERW